MKVTITLLFTTLLVVSYLFLTPYLALMSLKEAVQARDGEAIAERVEFPTVRESLKKQLQTKITNDLLPSGGQAATSPAVALMGTTISSSFIDNLVDDFITPSNLIGLLALGKSDPSKLDTIEDSNDAAIHSASLRYGGINQFSLWFDGEVGGITLVFSRRGLRWNITEIRLP